VRDLVTEYEFGGDNIMVIRDSALAGLEGESEGLEAIGKLPEELDKDIPEPHRDIDNAFLIVVQAIFSITGSRTIAMRHIEHGVVKIHKDIEIARLGDTKKTTYMGIEVFENYSTMAVRVIISACCCAVLKRRRWSAAKSFRRRRV
jgi:translation elongation factor EF-Tu-like GTPase